MKDGLLYLFRRFPEPVKARLIDSYIYGMKAFNRNYTSYSWDGVEFRHGYWDRITLGRAMGFVRNGMVYHERIPLENFTADPSRDGIVDIGSLFGIYTIVLAKLNPELPVHSFEPHPDNFELLNRNVELNGLTDGRVQVHQKVVSAESGTTEFYFAPIDYEFSCHTLFPTETHENYKPIAVEANSISDFCKEQNFRNPWVKIDAEGAEIEILEDLISADHIETARGLVELHLNRNHVT